jgi:23S rRNA (guanosine2251-2'-O)-methyltransferase
MIVNGTNDAELRKFQQMAKDKGVKVEFADRRALDKLSETGHHQGVIAFYTDFKYADLNETILSTRNDGKDILFIVLDEVLDPHNLGSVIRVAECAGATGVIIPARRSATVNETVVRTSAGATAYMPVIKVNNLNQAIEEMKKQNIWVYAADMDGEQMYKTNLKGDIALVVGGEGTGVRDLTKKLCDGVISIPMYGKVNSLNASVSAGIVLYEAVRQRV